MANKGTGLIQARKIVGDIELGFDPRANRPARVTAGGHIIGRPFQDIYAVDAVQNYILGSKREDCENMYRYAYNGGVQRVPGDLLAMPVPIATHLALVPVGVYAPGVTTFVITMPAVGALVNEYRDGYLAVDTGLGLGTKLRILSNTVAAGFANCTFVTYDPNPVAFDGTSRFQLVANPFNALIIHGSPPTARVAGVVPVLVPLNNFFWIQTKGLALVIATGGMVSGQHVAASITVDGTVDLAVANQSTTTVAGKAVRTAAGAAWGFIDLQLE